MSGEASKKGVGKFDITARQGYNFEGAKVVRITPQNIPEGLPKNKLQLCAMFAGADPFKAEKVPWQTLGKEGYVDIPLSDALIDKGTTLDCYAVIYPDKEAGIDDDVVIRQSVKLSPVVNKMLPGSSVEAITSLDIDAETGQHFITAAGIGGDPRIVGEGKDRKVTHGLVSRLLVEKDGKYEVAEGWKYIPLSGIRYDVEPGDKVQVQVSRWQTKEHKEAKLLPANVAVKEFTVPDLTKSLEIEQNLASGAANLENGDTSTRAFMKKLPDLDPLGDNGQKSANHRAMPHNPGLDLM